MFSSQKEWATLVGPVALGGRDKSKNGVIKAGDDFR